MRASEQERDTQRRKAARDKEEEQRLCNTYVIPEESLVLNARDVPAPVTADTLAGVHADPGLPGFVFRANARSVVQCV